MDHLSAHRFFTASSVPPVLASADARSYPLLDGITTAKLLGACGVSLLLMRCFFLRR